jgi:type III secretion protein J
MAEAARPATSWGQRFGRLLAVLVLAGLVSACEDEIYRNLSQRDANEMVAVLARNGVSASRATGENGTYRLLVSSGSFPLAVEVLRQAGYPRETYRSIADIFPGDSLITSPFEQRARMTYALNQEIGRTLSGIDGVVSARVHVVVPDADLRGAPQVRPSASVMIQALPSIDADELAPKIRQLVASSVAGLNYRDVAVAFFPASGEGGPIDTGQSQTGSVTRGLAAPAGSGSDSLLFGVAVALALAAALAVWRSLRQKAT